MLDAGISELRRSFSDHSKAAESGTLPSHFLLLFYAVECGLKACILKDHGKLKLSDVNKNIIDKIYTHDLLYLLTKLRWAVGGTNLNFRLNRGGPCAIEKVHEAWRYGIQLDRNDENKIIGWLKTIQKKIERNIY